MRPKKLLKIGLPLLACIFSGVWLVWQVGSTDLQTVLEYVHSSNVDEAATQTRTFHQAELGGSSSKSRQRNPGKSFADETINKPRPNIIFILTDQQNYEAISMAGRRNKIISTPNMDRIAVSDGVVFDTALTHCPVCGPARTSLLTGLTTDKSGVRTNDDAYINVSDSSVRTYDQYLVDEGYVAEYYGKWHSPPNLQSCYSNEVYPNPWLPYLQFLKSSNLTKPTLSELPNGTQLHMYDEWPYYTIPLDTRHGLPPGSTLSRDGKQVIEPNMHGVSTVPATHTLTAFDGARALQALNRLARGEKPFSLHVSFTSPHSPITPSEPYASLYKASDMPVSPSIADPMEFSPYIHANQRLKYTEYRIPENIQQMTAHYYAFVTEVDVWVGKILDQIDALGITNNTLLVFTSDHGEMLGAHGMREKNVFYEESVRVPLMMRFPGVIPAGKVVSRPVSHLDLFATILDYLGASQRPSDGSSLRNVIEETEQEESDDDDKLDNSTKYAISEWTWHAPGITAGLMVRTSKWKLFIPTTANSKVPDALYNLESDPHEMLNLLAPPKKLNFRQHVLKLFAPQQQHFRQQALQLRALMVEWLIKVNSPALEGVRARQF